jgi:hypothetical protein
VEYKKKETFYVESTLNYELIKSAKVDIVKETKKQLAHRLIDAFVDIDIDDALISISFKEEDDFPNYPLFGDNYLKITAKARVYSNE